MSDFKGLLNDSISERSDPQIEIKKYKKCFDYCILQMFDADATLQSIKHDVLSKAKEGRYELDGGKKFICGHRCYLKEYHHSVKLSEQQENFLKKFNTDAVNCKSVVEYFSQLYPDISFFLSCDWNYNALFTYELYTEKFRSGLLGDYHCFYINERFKNYLEKLKDSAEKDGICVEFYFDVNGEKILEGGNFKHRAGDSSELTVKLVVKYNISF